jgi:hypothetical protein
MNDSARVDELTAILEPIITATSYDGYVLRIVSASSSTVQLAIDATPEACADCLAPSAVIRGMVAETLSNGGVPMLPEQVTIEYPAGSAAH